MYRKLELSRMFALTLIKTGEAVGSYGNDYRAEHGRYTEKDGVCIGVSI